MIKCGVTPDTTADGGMCGHVSLVLNRGQDLHQRGAARPPHMGMPRWVTSRNIKLNSILEVLCVI